MLGTNEVVHIQVGSCGISAGVTALYTGPPQVSHTIPVSLDGVGEIILRLGLDSATSQVEASFSIDMGSTFMVMPLPSPGRVFTSGDSAVVSIFGSVQVPTTTLSVASSDVPKVIPDPGSVISAVTVPSNGRIVDVTTSFSFTHQCERDLVMRLRHPDGTTNVVMNRGLQRCSGVATTFTSTSLTMQNMIGKSPAGLWTFTATDDMADGYSGTLNSWQLNFVLE